MSGLVSRLERFERVDTTQRVVREWLDQGVPEVCLAVADTQAAGRGRLGREWQAPTGAALLVSAGFRPPDLALRHGWRLAAIVAMAMLDAVEEVAGLRDSALSLKWPNDIVVDGPDGGPRKVAGVLGEVIADDDGVASACIGIGVNVDWAAADFPPDLAASMSSLREASGGRPVDREALLEAWMDRLEPRYEALRLGRFDAGGWSARQSTTGRAVELDAGGRRLCGIAEGVDPEAGALLVRIGSEPGITAVGSGEVTGCRIVAASPPARRHVVRAFEPGDRNG